MNSPYPERLYYADPYLTRFEAHVVESLTWEGHPAVVLDRTAFYPTGGGQPSDRGALDAVAVVGVEVRESDGAILHLLAGEPPTGRVVGQVDWARRFDHMQQHTGQHLLSAACERLLDAATISFHLGAESSTIDLAVPRLDPTALEPVEEEVNRIIWENRPVTARFVSPEELARLPLRRPPQVSGPVRVVEVADFECSPCGGTHVTRSGEIGLLKVLRLEYRGQETRVEFVCGGRALRDYRRKQQVLLSAAATLTVGYWDLPDALMRLQEELKETRHELRLAQEQALQETATRLLETATPAGPLRLVWAVFDGRASAELRALAQKVVVHPDTVALLASVGNERVHLCAARAEGLTVDAAALLRVVCAALDGKGGGQPPLAQGSAPPTPRQRVEEALRSALSSLSP
jgi:alanyl-tRNA synthetase